jgi:hypothetical protein
LQAKLISIRTRRYSQFFQQVLREYATGTTALIDHQSYAPSEFPQLLETWCTNAKITATREFRLMRGESELFSFHDYPDELWAACSELPFVERLASDQIIRYRIYPVQPGTPAWLPMAVIFLVVAALFLLYRLLPWLL